MLALEFYKLKSVIFVQFIAFLKRQMEPLSPVRSLFSIPFN